MAALRLYNHMEITNEIIERSVNEQLFGSFEPFVTGDSAAVGSFYKRVFAALERLHNVNVVPEPDHYGSGYASYVSVFLYPRDGRSRRDSPDRVETTGILLYMSRLAPIAVFGRDRRSQNKHNSGASYGFIRTENLGKLPDGDWSDFFYAVRKCIEAQGIEFLPSEPLLRPAPEGVDIPTIFSGPYYVFDTLFYWCD